MDGVEAESLRAEGSLQRVPAPESEMSTAKTTNLEDCRDTIEGEAMGPRLLRELEHLSVSTSATTKHPISPESVQPNTRGSPELDSTMGRGTRTPDDMNRHSPAAGNSPSTSQVSVGSVGPSLVATALSTAVRHHYDLTPVTRNTSREQYVEHALRSRKNDDFPMVSPEEGEVTLEELHGEHLALPSDLGSLSDGPSLIPPLQSERARGKLDQQMLWQHDARHEEQLPPGVAEPVQFPARKSYTFTSREQYEEHHHHHHEGPAPAQAGGSPRAEGLVPYQPTRDDDLEGVGHIPEEELDQIFSRRRDAANGSSGNGESHANHRLQLNRPIPLEDRETSIPSIHLAHHLHGSTTSYTDYTENTEEDEESLLYVRSLDDDVSLSSRGSSLYLPDQDTSIPQPILPLGPSRKGGVVMEELNRVIADAYRSNRDDDDDDDSIDAVVGVNSHGGRRRKRKQSRREEENKSAMDWLQSVKDDRNVVAEAASSKFLRTPDVVAGAPIPLVAVASLNNDVHSRRQTMPAHVFRAAPVHSDDEAPPPPPPTSEASSPSY